MGAGYAAWLCGLSTVVPSAVCAPRLVSAAGHYRFGFSAVRTGYGGAVVDSLFCKPQACYHSYGLPFVG